MADASDRVVALLAIHPHYAEAILDGTKRVEFRKRGFSHPPDFIAIYATNPIGKIVGLFEVEGVDQGRPRDLWEQYNPVGGITARAFSDYYKGISRGVAIRVGRVHEFQEPLPLSDLPDRSVPPQSFAYLTARDLSAIQPELRSLSRQFCLALGN